MDQYDSLWWCRPGSTNPEQLEDPVDIPADTQPPAPAALATSQSILTQQMTAFVLIKEHIIAHSGPEHCHPEADSAPSGIILALEHAISQPTRAITGPSFRDQPMPPEEPTTGEERQLSHHLHNILHPPSDHFDRGATSSL
ncbi:hypothetical protein CK203_048384 [Vitis vinifera]|uniref:Uncharacterized protein n=1 Tax=Vitis vinifera TaxID=29760 RepID=A0A438HRJ7_VITVI|nr:hypothetical protein CK203_048384 [Vitis vinifera]